MRAAGGALRAAHAAGPLRRNAPFARVAESIKAMQRDVVADLRQDARPTGEVPRSRYSRST
ncbi:hypothetical protein, partial [Actinomadura sp. NPDC049753]|uniref:hypothetical protein n=1 Tax=Actinomadura sp. NPDC049753 TaxID=3154739 RepID=UPI00343E4DD9